MNLRRLFSTVICTWEAAISENEVLLFLPKLEQEFDFFSIVIKLILSRKREREKENVFESTRQSKRVHKWPMEASYQF